MINDSWSSVCPPRPHTVAWPFDKVPDRRLLMKLDAHGIVGKVLKWIESMGSRLKVWGQIENELYLMVISESGEMYHKDRF